MRTARKLFFFFLAFFAFSILLLKPASAQTYTSLNTDPDVPQNLHTYTQNQLIDTLSAFVCQIAGVDPTTKDGRCLGVNPETGKVGYVNTNGGAIGFTSNLIAMTFNIPFHTSDYVRYLAGNFGIVKPVAAANDAGSGAGATAAPQSSLGEGFSSLQNLLPVWVSFRDITYLVFVLVFVVIGIAIMLRVKIDPRTVMTLQNQIPKIIIGLILVTFSFAIAAFLIDLMWISMYFLFNVFSKIDGKIGADYINNVYKATPGYFGSTLGFGAIPEAAAGGIGSILVDIFQGTIGTYIVGIIGAFVAGFAGQAIGGFFGSPIIGGLIGGIIGGIGSVGAKNELLGTIGTLLGFVIILIALLVAMFRLWFSLLQTYIMILIDILLAPFWIIAGLLPGRSIGFGAWLKDLGANLFAFPTVFLMFLLGKTIIDLMVGKAAQFVPPFIGNPTSPAIITNNPTVTNSLSGIIGLGIILLTPNAVNFTKAIFKAPKIDASPVMQAIGAGIAVPINAVKGVGQTITGSKEAYLKPIAGGQVRYESRGMARSFLSKILR